MKKSMLHGCHKKEHGSEMAQSQHENSDNIFGVTIKVAEPGYIPAGIKLRGHISDNLITATVTSQDMKNLETDSRVVSISAPRKLHSAKHDTVA
ncbi:MAG: hypothetical protein AAFS12_04625 [Cyanobacteria bacterium J06632_19]